LAEPPARFVELVATITGRIKGKPVAPDLAATLSAEFPPEGSVFTELEALCHTGCAEGWLCGREHGGIKFGRILPPGETTDGFSVDVVEMTDVIGPHHTHPNGEIDMVMPVDPSAKFDGVPRGWTVYGAGSAHRPTVEGGKALILYLLPQGSIEFSRG
jgi:hypothetical protein